jgi:hypothetical protein
MLPLSKKTRKFQNVGKFAKNILARAVIQEET